jgi:hypothetical protein
VTGHLLRKSQIDKRTNYTLRPLFQPIKANTSQDIHKIKQYCNAQSTYQ